MRRPRRLPITSKVPLVDVAAIGINATDTIIELPRFPEFNSKLEFSSARVSAGGQTASAVICCRRWGFSARYIGSIGDDDAARLQRAELRKARVEAHLIEIPHCASQISFILTGGDSGERTILWKRDKRLTLRPEQIRYEWVERARILLVDGHDARASAAAARIARGAGIPVVADCDNLYPGAEELLRFTDYLFAAREFPERLMKDANLLETLPAISCKYGCRVAGATLGKDGALAWNGGRFYYSRAFRVRTVDTTGAGDIFHAGIACGILRKWPLPRILDFANAAAALNCTAVGARGGIPVLHEVYKLMRMGRRHAAAFSEAELRNAQRKLKI